MLASIAWLFAAVPFFSVNPLIAAGTGADDLQGIWRLKSLEAEAGAVRLPAPSPELVIKADRVLYGGEEIARIVTDVATNPKVLDLRFPNPERVYEGVYAVEKESLKVCLNGSTAGIKERPLSFSLKDHPGWRLFVLERVKAESAATANGFVGVALRAGEKPGEAIIVEVLDGSPAQKAGLRKDDVLLKVGDTAVTDLRSVVDAMRQTKPGSEVALHLRRDGKERDVTVKVGLFPFARLVGLE